VDVGEEPVEVEVEVRQEVELVDDHHVHGVEHDRVLERLLLAFGDGVDHRPDVLADVELGRAHEVADVLDDEEVELGEGQPGQAGAHHHRVQMALAAEAGARVDEGHLGAEPGELVGVEAGRDVTFQHADAHPPRELGQRALQEGRLAGARRRHQVDRPHARRGERGPVGVGDAIVLGQDVLEHADARRAGVRVPAVVADVATTGAGPVLVGVLVVMGVVVPVVVAVEATHVSARLRPRRAPRGAARVR
jgi:hypothetical protein